MEVSWDLMDLNDIHVIFMVIQGVNAELLVNER